jgi:hypothetical protein
MRLILRCLAGAICVLVSLGSAQAQSVKIGETAVLSAADGQNGNLLLAQSAQLAQAATVESLSFYVTVASGNLILGIYDATGPNGGPGALKATNSFTPATGWNTAKVVTPVLLPAGAYWLAYLPSSNALSFVKTEASGNCAYYSHTFGNLPSPFSSSQSSCAPGHWSFYATLAGPDLTSGLLPSYDDAYANWKNAGLLSVGGIPNRATVCATVNPLGGGRDDFTDIQKAINGCPAGEVVQLGAGTFTVHIADLPIQISKGIILRGTGNCSGSSSPYCQTSITVSDGALAYTGGMCGTSNFQ